MANQHVELSLSKDKMSFMIFFNIISHYMFRIYFVKGIIFDHRILDYNFFL